MRRSSPVPVPPVAAIPALSLRVRDFSLAYPTDSGPRVAIRLDGVDFRPGEITAVLGPSGCGKTTLLHALAGFFHRPGEGRRGAVLRGEISVNGREIEGLRPGTALLFQDFGLFPWKTLRQNVGLPLRLRRLPHAERDIRVDALLAELGLDDSASYYPAKISGGMKQRTALARAFVAEPDLLLLDEPFSSLDALTREAAQDLLLRVRQRRPLTTLLVTHSVEEAVCLGRQILVLGGNRPGRFAALVDVERLADEEGDFRQTELFSRQVREVRRLLASPPPPAGGEAGSGFVAPVTSRPPASPLPAPAFAANQAPRPEKAETPASPLGEAQPGAPGETPISNPASEPDSASAQDGPSDARGRTFSEGGAGTGKRNSVFPKKTAPGRERKPLGAAVSQALRMAAAVGGLLLLWQLAALAVAKPFLPGPLPTLGRFAELWGEGVLAAHTLVSARRVFLAVLAAALPAVALGLAAGRSGKVDAVVAPLLYLLHPLPKIAFLPLVMLLVGLGEESKILLIALIVFSQLVFSARDAARRTPETLVESLLSLGGGRRALLVHVLVPQILPELFTALRISLGAGIAVLFFSETFATVEGLGWFVMDAWTRVNYTELYAAVVALGLFGLACFVLLDGLERLVCRWNRR